MSHEEEHLVTLMWELNCADGEAGLCEDPECDPDVDGEWMAACSLCEFLVMAPSDQYTGHRTPGCGPSPRDTSKIQKLSVAWIDFPDLRHCSPFSPSSSIRGLIRRQFGLKH
ncbi:hypothetical protein ACFQVD_08275 [Streptosporangium amethystogenes subsp. fukuiense]|uniref:Uncharacterized protein n=1 Tax=Streptosporangium amethystogenes subsp. fukuiense TaxID=698418 RepID=A0ABW2SUY5_9ACTN